jgi:hypothetical protein
LPMDDENHLALFEVHEFELRFALSSAGRALGKADGDSVFFTRAGAKYVNQAEERVANGKEDCDHWMGATPKYCRAPDFHAARGGTVAAMAIGREDVARMDRQPREIGVGGGIVEVFAARWTNSLRRGNDAEVAMGTLAGHGVESVVE